jgi:hypothetical protein
LEAVQVVSGGLETILIGHPINVNNSFTVPSRSASGKEGASELPCWTGLTFNPTRATIQTPPGHAWDGAETG